MTSTLDFAMIESFVRIATLLERVKYLKATAREGAAVRAAWSRYFRRQSYYVIRKLLPSLRELFEAAREDEFLRRIGDFDDRDVVSRATKDAVLAAFAKGANTLKQLATAFDLDNPLAVEYADRAAAELVTRVTETTRKEIRSVITTALDEGWAYNKLAREMRRKFEEFSTTRAKLIAVTELGNAYSEGTLVAARQLETQGLRMEKSWLTVGDGRVSEECQSNAGAGWLRLDAIFPGGVGRPLQHPRCRCTLLTRAR